MAGIANPFNIVKKIAKSIPDRSSPGSRRAALGVKAAGHSAKNGLQDPGSSAEQPGQIIAELLEEQPRRKNGQHQKTKI